MRKVEVSIEVDAPPGFVLSAFTDAGHLKNWWGVARSLIELRKGGLYALAWNVTEQGMGYVSTGIIKEYLPGCQLHIEQLAYFNPQRPILGPLELVFLTTPENGKTLLTIIQSGYQSGSDWDWYYEVVKTAWPEVIKRIKVYIEEQHKGLS